MLLPSRQGGPAAEAVKLLSPASFRSGIRAAPGTQALSGQLPGEGKSLTFPQRSPGCQALYKTQEETPPVPKGNLKQIQGRQKGHSETKKTFADIFVGLSMGFRNVNVMLYDGETLA